MLKYNKGYILFIIIVIPVYVLFFTSNLWFPKAKENKSSNYNCTLELTDYYVKIMNAVYNTDTNEFSFDFYIKKKFAKTTATSPDIYSISANYDLNTALEYKSSDENGSYAKHIIVNDVQSDFWYIRIFLQSKTADTKVPDSIDEFGNKIPGYIVEGEYDYPELEIDYRNVTFMNNAEAQTTTRPVTSVEFETSIKKQKSDDNKDTQTYISTEKNAVTTASSSESFLNETTDTFQTQASQDNVTYPASTTSLPFQSVNQGDTHTTVTTDIYSRISDSTTTTASDETTKTHTTQSSTTTSRKVSTRAATTTKDDDFPEMPDIPVTGIRLSTSAADNNVILSIGDTSTITAVISPSSATTKSVTWSSNKPTIAYINSSGKVLARSPGKAIITATTEDGSLTASCMVTVVE